ncbi:hypothetical protein AcV7_002219 [Taiwanofungus camphoratus]|nr:hypothetical protein AcV7_002219 [Antrodia cinnamomea]
MDHVADGALLVLTHRPNTRTSPPVVHDTPGTAARTRDGRFTGASRVCGLPGLSPASRIVISKCNRPSRHAH